MVIDLRVGLRKEPPLQGTDYPHESMWFVPDGIVHPDYSAANPVKENGEVQGPIPPAIVCSEIVAEQFTGEFSCDRNLSGRFLIV